ncbi:OsmC family protein [Natronospira bacteriovora]|uniref:OsmC family protein n=1 Tax=Natronospira bacteriovora TaxID=3069753 RepID=A0ABU0WA18_9GAMM|nr:OsmC family protein [Natronospira sp. AB-CW4]MDQ2070886.1 OsmC family protein [Natronospira sp. AB-CW4]
MQASVKWIDDMRFVATSGSGHSVVMDGDQGRHGPSPMEMVLMAAGSCSSVDVVGILEKARQPVWSCEVELSAERADSTPAVFTRIHMRFIITGAGVSEKHVERAVKLSADKYCSVSIMLGHSVEVSHDFEIRED